MRYRGFWALVATLVALWGPAASAAPRLAVLGVEPKDEGDSRSQQKTAALAKALTDSLRARAGREGSGYELTPNAQKELMELKLLSDCLDENADCMAAIGRDLGTDLVLYGQLQKKATGYDVSLRSITVGTRATGELKLERSLSAAEATEEGMKKLAPEVFPDAEPAAPAHETALIVETNVGEGTIYVNGAPRGVVTPKKTTIIRGLPPGNVLLAVDSPGYQRTEVTVEIRDGQAARAAITLEPAVAPPPLAPPVEQPVAHERGGGTARVLFWTSLVATGAGITAFTITGLKVRSIEKEQDDAIAKFDYSKNGVQFPNDACAEAKNDGNPKLVDICDRGKSMATITNVLIGVTAVTAVATAIFYWRGYLAEDAKPREAQARGKPPGRRLVVSPEIYQGGGGVGAVIQF